MTTEISVMYGSEKVKGFGLCFYLPHSKAVLAHINLCSAGIVFRRQNLTSKVDPRTDIFKLDNGRIPITYRYVF